MEQDFDLKHWEDRNCPKVDCKNNACKCGIKKVFLPAALGDDSAKSPIAPKNGAYCNAIVVYEANGHVYIYSTEGIPTLITTEGGSSEEAIEELTRRLNGEILNRGAADNVLQGEIDAIKNSPDVVDIVATYTALQEYDTSKLTDKDIIRVLADETHDGQSTYYRWNAITSSWTYVGAVGDYYTKGQVDTLLADKQNKLTAGANITIDADNEISATDTTYSNFTGTDGVDSGTAGLVPAPATTDAGKFLNAAGSWEVAGGGGAEFIELTTADYNWNSSTGQTGTPNCVALWLLPSGIYKGPASTSIEVQATRSQNYSMGAGFSSYAIVKECENTNTNRAIVTYVDGSNGNVVEYYSIDENGQNYSTKNFPNVVQSTGTSTTNVMSQNATTSMVYADPSTMYKVNIGAGNTIDSSATAGVIIGKNAQIQSGADESIRIGSNGLCYGPYSIAIGYNAQSAAGSYGNTTGSIAIGRDAVTRNGGEVSIGASASTLQSGLYGAVNLGAYSRATRGGEVNVGSTNTMYGHNSTNYRVIGGVHDAQGDHDAVTLGQLNSRIIGSLASAPTTSTVGSVGSLLATVESGTGHLYICTDDTGGVYTWQTLV